MAIGVNFTVQHKNKIAIYTIFILLLTEQTSKIIENLIKTFNTM